MAFLCLALVATTAPGAAAVSVTLHWTAPGDDGAVGRAQAYALRYSSTPITPANFAGATLVSGLATPLPAGSPESFTVTGLAPNLGYYFAIETCDEAGHWSSLSNVVFIPAQIVDVEDAPLALAFSAPQPNPARHSARFTWVLPEAAPIDVTAFDLAGRPVKTLAGGWRASGQGEVTWDLRDTAGRRVAAGTYLVRARLGARVWTRRLMVVP
jgi:flagellar hook capping protein FlgD